MTKRIKTVVKEINEMFPPAYPDHPVAFVRDGEPDRLIVTGECHAFGIFEGDRFEYPVIEYYPDDGGYPRINKRLEKYLQDVGYFWEWENPACICCVPDESVRPSLPPKLDDSPNTVPSRPARVSMVTAMLRRATVRGRFVPPSRWDQLDHSLWNYANPKPTYNELEESGPRRYIDRDMIDSLITYVAEGWSDPCDEFLQAVLRNDLRAAVKYLPTDNAWRLPSMVLWLEEVAPATCWGSQDKILQWKRSGGFAGEDGAVIGKAVKAVR